MSAFRVTTLLVLAAHLFADTRTVTKTTFGGRESIATEYVQGKNRRIEYSGGYGTRPTVFIFLDWKVTYQLDVLSRKYVEQRSSPDAVMSLAALIARPLSTYQSGKNVDIYFETTDTGETKEFFGRVAKHFLLRERRVAEPGACETSSQTERDGWYILEQDRSSGRGYIFAALSTRHGRLCQDKLVFHGHAPAGLAVVETSGSMKREILELSNAPLEKSLFEAPGDFEKVEALPGQPASSWSKRISWEWASLERAFESWFR